jgi:4'-phosphopantetheinyl transferase
MAPKMLKYGEFDVWRIKGNPDLSLLSRDELERFHAMSGEKTRQMFSLSRSAIRKIVDFYKVQEIAEKCIHVHPGGKPFFVNNPDLHFSLSHTEDELAIAFSCTPVGFDLEKKGRRGREWASLARRFFSPEEASQVEATGGDVERCFLEFWTGKEAILKLDGSGISGGLERARVWSDSEGSLGERRVYLHRMDWPAHIAHIASFEKISSVRLRELILE